MSKKVSSQLSDFLSLTRTLDQQYNLAKSAVLDSDKITQDLLHQIELGSAKDRNKYATVLSRVRKQRRVSKDIIDVTENLVTYLRSKEVITVIRHLEQLLGDVRKQESYVENHRKYNPKAYKNLSINLTEENKNE